MISKIFELLVLHERRFLTSSQHGLLYQALYQRQPPTISTLVAPLGLYQKTDHHSIDILREAFTYAFSFLTNVHTFLKMRH